MSILKINRVYIPYWEWECWKNGMWRNNDESLINEAIKFTSDWKVYGDAMEEVINKWPNTMFHHLTNSSANKRAHLGHCACNYKLGISELITRMAWKHLTERQRIDADEIAQLIIDDWLYKNRKLINEKSNDIRFDYNKFRDLNFIDKINEYVDIWERRCYPNGIPDEGPYEIFNKVPSYKRITLAILKNDHNLETLGFTPKKSVYYSMLKKIEIENRNDTSRISK